MVPFQNPSIELFGLRIDEPITVLTDMMVAAVGFIAYFSTISSSNSRAVQLYRYFFLFTAFSTLVAGFIGHAFAYKVGFEWRMIGWSFGIASVAFAQFAVLQHTIESIGEKAALILRIFNVIELIVIVFILAFYRTFIIVEIQAAIGLVLMVLMLESIHYNKTKSSFSLGLIIGIGITILAVISHVAKLAVSNWFNHMDLGHVLMAIALFVMYKGLQSEQKLNPVTI